MKRLPGESERAAVCSCPLETGKAILPVTKQVQLAITVVRVLGTILLPGDQDSQGSSSGPDSDIFLRNFAISMGSRAKYTQSSSLASGPLGTDVAFVGRYFRPTKPKNGLEMEKI